MDTSLESQLETIRLATLAMQQTLGQEKTLTLKIEWSDEVYETSQTTLLLPKGLKVSGSWENLKIEYETGLQYQPIPELTVAQENSLKELNNSFFTSFLTILWVVFLWAFFFDLLYKRLLK